VASLMAQALRSRTDDGALAACVTRSRHFVANSILTPPSPLDHGQTSPRTWWSWSSGAHHSGGEPSREDHLAEGRYCAQPDERKSAREGNPYGGGAAMFVGFCLALLVAFAIPSLRLIINLFARDDGCAYRYGRDLRGRGHRRLS